MPESYHEDGTDKVFMQLCMLTEHIDKGTEEKGMKKGYNQKYCEAFIFHANKH
jgi:hypothetical protein